MTPDLLLTIEQLGIGETKRMDCPTCGRAKTFTVTRKDDGAVWNCYSVHCGNKGATGAGNRATLVRTRNEAIAHKIHPFMGELKELDEQQRTFLRLRVGFGEQEFGRSGVRYAPMEDRYAYPIYSPTGRRRGWVLRAYDGHDPRWKALTRLEVAEPHLSWYQGTGHTNRVLVVEDIPSAVRAASFFPGWVVAMCGGGLGSDYVREIQAYAKHVVWAFDGDATVAALSHHRRFGICFESSVVLPLDSDFKDMDDDSIKEKLSCVM
jgi:hypothetical protein